jgi:hypothetical protein
MSVVGTHLSITFEADLPLPETNVWLYRHIYTLEQWLRRIALAALAGRYGTQWHGAIPTPIAKNLKVRIAALRDRVTFDTENSDNAIWCLTLDELKALLVYEKAWPHVKALTGFDRRELTARLDDLREIRNVIGHNRAATDYTAKVFEAIDAALAPGITCFRDRLLYDFEGRQAFETAGPDAVVTRFYETQSPLGPAHLLHDDYFYYVHVVPREQREPLAISDFLEHFDDVRRVLVACLLNRKSHGDYSLVWPRRASAGEHREFLGRFETFAPTPGQPYERQNPKYVCHPKVWFIY